MSRYSEVANPVAFTTVSFPGGLRPCTRAMRRNHGARTMLATPEPFVHSQRKPRAKPQEARSSEGTGEMRGAGKGGEILSA